MKISTLHSMEQFLSVRDDWNAVYAKDSDATIQRSWQWIKGWIESTTCRWFIVTVQSARDSTYLGFFPFGISEIDGNREKQLVLGGHPSSAHTGFVCDPAHARKAAQAVATYLKKNAHWNSLVLADAWDSRLGSFLKAFDPLRYRITENESTTCPYIVLPPDWESYLKHTLGPETGRTIRKKLRRLTGQEGYRQVVADGENLDECINIAFSLRKQRWGEKPEQRLREMRSIFKNCFEDKSLYAAVIYLADTPVAALIGFMDCQRKTFSCFMTGHDENYKKFSPGNLIIAKSIESAIENGFHTYDLGRGQSEYKYSLGCIDRYNKNYVIRERRWAVAWRMLQGEPIALAPAP